MTNLMVTGLQPGVEILLLVLFVLFAIAAIFFLYRGIRKDRNRYITEKLKVGELDRAGFDDLLSRRMENANKSARFTVMLIEINDAKPIKESFGEKQFSGAIDILIERLYKVLPKGTRICMYENDVLAVLIEADLDEKTLKEIAGFCLIEGHKPIQLVTRVKLELDLSIGIMSYAGDSGVKYVQFQQDLELALATSRRSGLNKYTVYSADLMGRETEEYRYYQEIKAAIDGNEFTLYYQPIVNLDTRQPVGYETLMRWNHKTLGVLSPNKFLSIMEQSGDINWVGTWAFEQLLIAEQRYLKNNPDSDVVFSMNLSPKQIMNPQLTEDFRRILRKYKVPAEKVCMEIVEFAIFDKIPVVTENISKLEQIGFKIAIDDFGLDISSLKILENLKCDWVKLDKSFIEQSKDDFLIGGVAGTLIGYAEKNGFKVIAEGVEEDVTLDYIKGLKIHYGQGYHFGKPQPPENYGI